jgi:GAF domain-containing protein
VTFTSDVVEDPATLRWRLEEATQRAESLRQVIETISSELTLEPLLTRMVASAAQVIGAQYGAIGLVVETAAGPVVRTVGVYNMPERELGAEMQPGVGLAGVVLREQKVVWVQRYGDLDQPTLPELADHTVIGMPIWQNSDMIGFFGIGAEAPHRFSAADVDTLALFARHAAIAIENAQRYQQEQRRNERLALIARIGRSITANLRLEEVLQNAADAIHELLGYENVSLSLIDSADASILVIRAMSGFIQPIGRREHRLPISEGIIGAAVRARRTQLVNNVAVDPRYIPTPGVVGINAELAVPILLGEAVLGVLNVESSEPFTDEDAASLQIIVDQLAVAIANVRLFEAEQQRVARRAAINQIGRLIASRLRLDELLPTVVEAIQTHLGYANIAILLVDPQDAQTLTLRARGGVYATHVSNNYQQSFDHGIIGEAARTRRRVLINDVRNDPRYIPVPNAPEIWAELAVPITAGDQLLGVLNVETDRSIGEEEAQNIETITDQLGIAIQNVSLFEAEQRRAARIALINRIGRIVTSTIGFQELFQTAVETIRESFQFAYVAAGVVEPENPEMLMLLAHAGSHTEPVTPGYRQSIYTGIVGAAARARHRVLVNNVADEPSYLPLLDDPAIRTELAVPIVVGDRLAGVLNIESDRPIHEEEADSIEIIADQFGIALENARLFGQMQRALQTTQMLYNTSQRISTAMRVEEVISAYLEQVAAHGRYVTTIALYEIDHMGQRSSVMVRGRWSPQDGVSLAELRLPYTRDALDLILDTGQTVTISNVFTDPRVSEELREIQRRDNRPALALIPLMVRGKRIGLVILSYTEIYKWPHADLQSCQATAAQLATAIDSRQQHSLLSQHGQQLAVMEERRRLARELHDSVTQSLFSMSLLAQVIPELWDLDQREARESLDQIRDLTRSVLAEMRALLFELRPVDLGEQSLVRALQHHAAAIEQRTNLAVKVMITGAIALPNHVEQALFRIVQEALANAARHAHARRVLLILDGGPPFRLTIKDDGKGFDPDRIPAGRFGLTSMRERAAEIGALLRIFSAIDRGAEIVIEWPGASHSN